ncbi:hypothetical protein [Chelativorans salis]|uniref:Uncharacterized protein n=1 Tax=Chelativorans salis TaxID=2978478 RepID=A0ABT2LQZ9_9HYPH|nr:hypothetical protein [Chelativorans sp. EGI FJ00035]MCT7376971.1 hypothetical protein [Chelativorans sp. EGI FJ00035]
MSRFQGDGLWFLSGELGEGDQTVLPVAEAADGGAMQKDCSEPHRDMLLSLGVPGLASTRDVPNTAYGVAVDQQTPAVL